MAQCKDCHKKLCTDENCSKTTCKCKQPSVEDIKIPAYYRHFKGKHSLVIGISYPTTVNELIMKYKDSCTDAIYSEAPNDTIPIYTDNLLNKFHNDLWSKEILVIYTTVDRNPKLCARPLNSFLDIVKDNKDNVTGQIHRFEEYKVRNIRLLEEYNG